MPVWSSSDVQPRSGIAMTAPREGERFLPACRSARRRQDRPDLGWAPTMWWCCVGRAGRDERRREANAAFLLCLSLSRFPGEALMFCHQSASDGLVVTSAASFKMGWSLDRIEVHWLAAGSSFPRKRKLGRVVAVGLFCALPARLCKVGAWAWTL